MDFLNWESFFHLDSFQHKALWKEGLPVWSPLHTLKEYLNTADLGKIEIEIPEGVYLKNRELISIGKGTVIEPGVLIIGPCIIGKNCTIHHGAYLRAHLIIGDECTIGHCSELKHSILLDGAKVTHFVYVGDSIIGSNVNLSAGVKCANLRLDRKEIQVQAMETNFTQTGLQKFGAIVGDDVQIGCNCVLNPGTLIQKRAVCYPLLTIKGTILAGSVIKHV